MTTNFFINLDYINGETTVEGRQDIAIQSWNHSFNQPSSLIPAKDGSYTLQPANHADFSFTKFIDSTSVRLMRACWAADTIKSAVFRAYHTDGNERVEYLKITMYNVIVSNLALGNNAEGQVTETVTLCYNKITYDYTPTNTAQAEHITATHDILHKTIS